MQSNFQLLAAFDRYEIHGVREFGRGRNRYCEQVPDSEAQFWSLYGHIPNQGVECIGDFKTREFAEQIYARITGELYSPITGERAHSEALVQSHSESFAMGDTRPNSERGRRIERVLEYYGDDEAPTTLTDFIADAMHWCRIEEHDFQSILTMAQMHFEVEVSEQEGVAL
jgi:hypothetical protein